MIKITKQTYRDFQAQLENLNIPGYVMDHDDTYLYVREWRDSPLSEYREYCEEYRYQYSLEGSGKVMVDLASKEEVLRDSTYKVVESKMEKAIKKVLSQFLPEVKQENIIKQFDEDTWTVVEPLYIAYGEVDGHGDTYKNPEAVHQLVKALNEANEAGTLQPSLFHLHKTKLFTIGNAYVNEKPAVLGDHKIPALQPLVEIVFKSQKAFEARKEGKLAGLSIGALGTTEFVKSLLDDIEKAERKPKRLISSFSFAHRGAHLAYTDWSVGGAASLKNEFYLVKSVMPAPVNKEQEDLLKDLEEEFVPLDKKLFDSADETAPSTSVTEEAVNAGVDNENLTKGSVPDMSEKLQKEIAELKKQLKAEKLEKSLGKYELDAEASESLSKALVELSDDHAAAVLKALDTVIAASDAKVVAETEAKAELEKQLEAAKADPKEENELAKQFAKEEGASTPASAVPAGELNLAQRVSANIKSKQQ